MEKAPNRRWILFFGAAALLLAGGAAALLAFGVGQSSAVRARQELANLGRGVDEIVLVNSEGDEVRWGALKGRPRAVFFGFTHCPVICPVTVWELNDAIDRIGGPASAIGIEFITIDPERDTPATLDTYFSGFGERVQGYSGTPEAIASIAAAFEVTYRRAEEADGGYSRDHTATVFLADTSGHVVDVIAYGSPQDVIEARLRALVGEAAPS